MALYTIQNEFLTVTVCDKGAELHSVKTADGCEYLWQGQTPGLWKDRAPVLFPICGQVFGGIYTWEGKTYELGGHHGFARRMTFRATQTSADCLRLTLTANEESRRVYPFEFSLSLCYRLKENRLFCTAEIENLGTGVMPFSFGLHPGFNVPLDDTAFEDWQLTFSQVCAPRELVINEDGFLTGEFIPRPLVEGRILPLSHSLFDINSPFYKEMADTVRLESSKSSRSVTLSYPGFLYLGLWHDEKTEAPYVCIEPWYGMASLQGVTDDFATKEDMITLKSGEKTALECVFTIE